MKIQTDRLNITDCENLLEYLNQRCEDQPDNKEYILNYIQTVQTILKKERQLELERITYKIDKAVEIRVREKTNRYGLNEEEILYCIDQLHNLPVRYHFNHKKVREHLNAKRYDKPQYLMDTINNLSYEDEGADFQLLLQNIYNFYSFISSKEGELICKRKAMYEMGLLSDEQFTMRFD